MLVKPKVAPVAPGLQTQWHYEWDYLAARYRRAWTCVQLQTVRGASTDYLAQLQAMGAQILVPIPGGPDSLFIADITNPSGQRKASDADLRSLAGKIQFSDSRRDAVQGVAGALGLDFTPKTFFAFFPKGMEEQLAREETKFRNRRAEDIEETVFRVTIRGGTYTLVVDEQIAKK